RHQELRGVAAGARPDRARHVRGLRPRDGRVRRAGLLHRADPRPARGVRDGRVHLLLQPGRAHGARHGPRFHDPVRRGGPAALPRSDPRTDDLCFLSIAELGSLIRARTVSPVEVIEAHLARIERLNPVLNAFVTVTAAEAREAARRAEAEVAAGRWRGPLAGGPIGADDLLDTAGGRTNPAPSVDPDQRANQ